MLNEYLWKKAPKLNTYFSDKAFSKYIDKTLYECAENVVIVDNKTIEMFKVKKTFMIKVSVPLLATALKIREKDALPAIAKGEGQTREYYSSLLAEHLLDTYKFDLSYAFTPLKSKHSQSIYDELYLLLCGMAGQMDFIKNDRRLNSFYFEYNKRGTSYHNIDELEENDIFHLIEYFINESRSHSNKLYDMYTDIFARLNSHDKKTVNSVKYKDIVALNNALENELIYAIAYYAKSLDAKSKVLEENIDEILKLPEYSKNFRKYKGEFVEFVG